MAERIGFEVDTLTVRIPMRGVPMVSPVCGLK